MTGRFAALALALACSVVMPSRIALAQRGLTQEDSVAIVRAAWDVSTKDFRVGRHPPALWLWTPTSDTARVVALSPALRVALIMQGIPASTRRPTGDDTVVVRVTRWREDSAHVTVELNSSWTTLLGSRAHRCRAGSGNVERFRVSALGKEWIAERFGAIIHGDGACTPIQ